MITGHGALFLPWSFTGENAVIAGEKQVQPSVSVRRAAPRKREVNIALR